MKKMQPIGILIIAVLILLTVSIVGLSLIARSEQSFADLEEEFRDIRPLPEVTRISYTSYRKWETGGAWVFGSYNSNSDYNEIYKHYDYELTRNGWIFVREDKIVDKNKSLVGNLAEYHKGDYAAILQYLYIGRDSYSATYELALRRQQMR